MSNLKLFIFPMSAFLVFGGYLAIKLSQFYLIKCRANFFFDKVRGKQTVFSWHPDNHLQFQESPYDLDKKITSRTELGYSLQGVHVVFSLKKLIFLKSLSGYLSSIIFGGKRGIYADLDSCCLLYQHIENVVFKKEGDKIIIAILQEDVQKRWLIKKVKLHIWTKIKLPYSQDFYNFLQSKPVEN